jgi:hypothetical protein
MENYARDDNNDRYMRLAVINWWAEFSEENYEICKEIISSLNLVKNSNIPEDVKIIVKSNGEKINSKGGLMALLSCYYIMLNFMNKQNKMYIVEILSDGIGE